MSGAEIRMMVDRGADPVADGIWTLGGQGNSMLVDHGEGLLLVDAGPGGEITERMIRDTRRVSDKPVTHIVISHGHLGYNFGIDQWRRHAASRSEPRPILVAHERVPVRYRRYAETSGLQSYMNTRQFRTPYPADFPAHWFEMPELTYRDRMRIAGTMRDVVLLAAPSETDDATAVWLPHARVLYGGCAFLKMCPNAGTPFRIFRDPLRWAQTLEDFLALRPAVLIPEFGRPIVDAADIEESLTMPIQAIRYLRREVVRRMNAGMSELELLHEIEYPDEIFGNRFLKPLYGCPDYLVREIWRSENGWWDRNPTTLHPAAPGDVAREILAALGDARAVIDRARTLQQRGDVQLALHVIDLVALAPADSPDVAEARALKAKLVEARSRQVVSAVSRNILLSEAELLSGRPVGASAGGEFQWT